MNANTTWSRREFLSALGSAAAALSVPAIALAEAGSWPIVVFSKFYQELKLGYEDAARVTAEAGLQGIDCPVRPGGEIEPERAGEELPRYAEALRRRGLRIELLTSGITSVKSAHAEQVLRAAKKEGVRYYRLGTANRPKGTRLTKSQLSEIHKQLQDLAAMNREIGVTAVLQNHSPGGNSVYLAGDLDEMLEVLAPLNPDEVGAVFDIGHALIVHQDGWAKRFEALKPHIRVAYVKDTKGTGGFVPFGSGKIAGTDFFKRLKAIGYNAPLSLHIEYDWTDGGKSKDVAGMIRTLRQSRTVVEQWVRA